MLLLSDVSRRFVIRAKPGIIAKLSIMREAGSRGLLRLEPQCGARTDRGFKTAVKLNYMKRLPKKERVTIEIHNGQRYPLRLGQAVALGGATFGLVALSLCGLGVFDEVVETTQDSNKWPNYVKDRVMAKFALFGGSCVVSALSAAAVMRIPALVYLLDSKPPLPLYWILALLFLTDVTMRTIPYEAGSGKKPSFWLLHSVLIGVAGVPIYNLVGPLVLRAAFLAAGVVSGFTVVAVSAPSKKFLEAAAPAGIVLGVVAASSIASIFVPPARALGSRWAAVSMYAGLFLFASAVMGNATKVVSKVESLHGSKQVYDPWALLTPFHVAVREGTLTTIRMIESYYRGSW